MWLLSVVAKEDLWWPGRDVDAFYGNGRYAEAVARLIAAKGAEQIRHELIRVSLLICNLVTGDDTMVKNVEGYDHRAQVAGVRRLLEVLDALREWEATT